MTASDHPPPPGGLELQPNVDAFFAGRLESALSERAVPASAWAREYLVGLLARFASDDLAARVQEPLGLRLAEALQEPAPWTRVAQLRDVGDDALYLSGFFDPWLTSRGIAASYVAALGGRAYGMVAASGRLSAEAARGYRELGERFQDLAHVLEDVREQTALRTPQDIVRLYDRYRRSPSLRLARRLRQAGVLVVKDGAGTGDAQDPWLH